mgnify:CR=1 FL=1|jgi:uncharacterized protein YabE (DUF348 family)
MIPKIKQLLKHPKNKVYVAVGIAVMVAITSLFGYTAYAYDKKTIKLVKNGIERSVDTTSDTVAELLREKHIQVKHHDFINPSLSTALSDGMTVVWHKAYHVTIAENGHGKSVWTTADTVGDLLDKQGIKVGSHDVVEPGLDQKIDRNMTIKIERGIQVTLSNGGEVKTVWTTPMTVAEFLKAEHLSVDADDKLGPKDLSTRLTNGDKVNVIRVEIKKEQKLEPLDFKVVKRYDDTMPKGTSKVIQAGREGQVKKTYEVTFENGKEVKRRMIQTDVQQEPTDKIIAVGTKNVQQMSYHRSGKVLYMKSTAYTANCGGCRGITSTGFNLKSHPDAKIIAVDPKVIPLGTRVYVEGYGNAIAADTGGSIHGNRIDIFFPTQSQAVRWGLRTVKVTILD